jgi:hypothetical protein
MVRSPDGTSLASIGARRISMTKTFLLSCLFALIATPALAQPKAGQYTGVRQCTATAGSIKVEATSKKTIGVANCKMALEKELTDKGICKDKKKNEKVEYSWQFGKDDDKDKASGTQKMSCKG